MYVLPYQRKQGLRWQSRGAICRLRMAIFDIAEYPFSAWRIKVALPNASELDISQPILSRLQSEGRTVLVQADVAEFFAQKTAPKFIRIDNVQLPHWRSLRIRFGTPFEIRLNAEPASAQTKTRIVYFINCYINKNYIYLFSRQMAELATTGLLNGTDSILYVVSSGTADDKSVLQKEIQRIFGSGSDIRQEHTEQNLFEYPGIRKVWELGRQDADAFILYFHARGISRIKLGRFRRNRQPLEKRLFRRVIGEWRQNLLWLTAMPSADKVGISQGGNGWLWFNFWWARASYIAQLEEPQQTERRHYYEDWLGRYARSAEGEYANTLDRCISIAFSETRSLYNIGSDFHPDRGETYLGLPGYYSRIIFFRLKRFIAKHR
jgi:hypothetical protein